MWWPIAPIPPNDGARETRFVILQTDGTARFHSLTYHWRAARAAMVAKALVQGDHTAPESGWWPSEDVLPEEMRRG